MGFVEYKKSRVLLLSLQVFGYPIKIVNLLRTLHYYNKKSKGLCVYIIGNVVSAKK